MLPTQKPRRGLDDAQLAAIVLGSLEHFPQYRDVFHAVSVRAVAQDPRYVTLARLTEAPTDDEAAAVAAGAFARAAAAMGAPEGAAALVARSLVAQPANARAVLLRSMENDEATQPLQSAADVIAAADAA